MSVDTERSSTESSAASRLGYEDTTLALTLRLPGSDSDRSSSLAAPSDAAPSPKARVVGWPPVRSYRKNALADSSKASRAANFVKVVVDGAAYLRKVDLQAGGSADEVTDGGAGTCCWQTGSRAPAGRRRRVQMLADSDAGTWWQTPAWSPAGNR
jgi:hypothetical protein